MPKSEAMVKHATPSGRVGWGGLMGSLRCAGSSHPSEIGVASHPKPLAQR